MRIRLRALAAVGAMLPLILGADAALAQKSGGILKVYHRDNPPSASIHEEATNSTVMPFMNVYNNLVIFDQTIARQSMDTIIPDLGESWSWNDDKSQLTFKLREGVTWHDGEPFTAEDVKCTWDLIQGNKEGARLRKNPRRIWYHNLKEVTTNGDHEVTFVLNRPQPSFIALLASGYSPVYPCHVSPADMRTHPIGTGPFKFVEFKQNEYIKLEKNEDYWDEGKPYLDGIEFTIISSRSTRVLGFINGEFDLTYSTDITIPLLKDVNNQAPEAVCSLVPTNVSRNLIVNSDAPPFDDPQIRKAMMLTIDRQAFIDILSEGKSDIGGAMLPPPEGLWGMPQEMLETIPGYGKDVEKNREEARKLMEEAGYGPDKRLPVKVSTRNIEIYRDPAVILIDHLKHIYMDGELEVVETPLWHAKVARKDYTVGMNLTGVGVDDPDVVFYENFACNSERNYTGYCNKELEEKFDRRLCTLRHLSALIQRGMTNDDLTLLEIMRRFSTEEAARAYFERTRWPNGPVCPHCGNSDHSRIYALTPNAKARIREGLYKCGECDDTFTVTVGTVMEKSKIPLHKWLIAFYMMCASKTQVSALQLQRQLELGSYRTALFLCHRIRYALKDVSPQEKLVGEVEADETYIGGKVKGKGRGFTKNKVAVVALVERGGNVRSTVTERVSGASMDTLLRRHIAEEAHLNTDESPVYRKAGERFASHSTVNHSEEEYSYYDYRSGRTVSTNAVEGFFGNSKRSLDGTHHQISRKHLHLYAAELDFKYNTRKVTDGERTSRGIQGIEGKRLMMHRPKTPR